MKKTWDNLRPSEKRMVAAVGVVVFVLLNLWFVVPHFSDWGKVQARMVKAQSNLSLFQNEIDQSPRIKNSVEKLMRDAGSVPQEEQTTHFQGGVQAEAARTGVILSSVAKILTRTNQFFIELTQTVQTQSKEQQLVDFLYNLGQGDSLIRVRGLTLHPDQPHQQLIGTVTLVASYQKKTPLKSAGTTANPVAPKPVKPTTPVSPPPGTTTAPKTPPVKTALPNTGRPATPAGKAPLPAPKNNATKTSGQ